MRKQSTKITVLLGGFSSEREISILSGKGVYEALRELGYQVEMLDVTRDLAKLIQTLKEQQPDIVFNALHGPFGEDGTIQGVLSWLDIPYTHSGVLASALAMNKDAARKMFHNDHLPIAKGGVIRIDDLRGNHPFEKAYILKPICDGSSVDVHLIEPGKTDMTKLLAQWHSGDKGLVEEFIHGPEVTVGILDDGPLTITDITTDNGHSLFYDYRAKYGAGQSSHTLPAKLDKALAEQVLTYAEGAHKALGCRGVSRVDFKIDVTRPNNPHPVILEVNTQPGMTATSLLPEQAQYCGISYGELCEKLLQSASAQL